MSGDQILLLLVACVALLGLFLVLWQGRNCRRLGREIEDLRATIEEQLTAKVAPPVNFSTSLDAIERQQLQAAQMKPPAKSVDKYSYIGSLAEQGLDAKGIAEALQMPRAEVEQLLQLVKLKQTATVK